MIRWCVIAFWINDYFFNFKKILGDIMKIVSWNCNRGFWKKFDAISELNADIYVICECGNPAKSEDDGYKSFAKNYIWIGEDKNMGLGIFAKDDDVKLELIPHKNELAGDYLVVKNKEKCSIGKKAEEAKKFKEIPVEDYIQFRHFLPVRVNNSFNLLAVWAMGGDKKGGSNKYVELIHDFLDENRGNEKLFDGTIIMCGDFNSSSVFNGHHKAKDSDENPKNHDCLNKKLNDLGLCSIYHELTGENSGEEKTMTFFQSKNLYKYYHLDYVYANKEFIEEKTTFIENGEKQEDLPNEFEILDIDDWISLSDHSPLVFKFEE